MQLMKCKLSPYLAHSTIDRYPCLLPRIIMLISFHVYRSQCKYFITEEIFIKHNKTFVKTTNTGCRENDVDTEKAKECEECVRGKKYLPRNIKKGEINYINTNIWNL